MTPLVCRLFDDGIRDPAREFVNEVGGGLTLFAAFDNVPDGAHDGLVIEDVEDAVTAEENEVVEVFTDAEMGYFRCRNNYAFFTAVFVVF